MTGAQCVGEGLAIKAVRMFHTFPAKRSFTSCGQLCEEMAVDCGGDDYGAENYSQPMPSPSLSKS